MHVQELSQYSVLFIHLNWVHFFRNKAFHMGMAASSLLSCRSQYDASSGMMLISYKARVRERIAFLFKSGGQWHRASLQRGGIIL